MRQFIIIISMFAALKMQGQERYLYLTRWNGTGWDSLYINGTDSIFNKVDGNFVFNRRITTKRHAPYALVNNMPAYLTPSGDGSQLTGLTKSQVGLGNADNTSDATKNAASVTLTNKTISGANNTLSNIPITAVTGYTGYTLSVQALTSSPADGATIYFGNMLKAPTTTANISKVYIRKAGTIKIAEIYCYSGTAGSNESWSLYVRVNNTTDNLIATLSASTSERVFSNTGLSIAVSAGDYIEIKAVNPTWGTNPLTTIFGGYLYIE